MAESVGSIYYTVEADTQKLLDSVRPTDASLDDLNKRLGRTDKAAKQTEFQMTKTAKAVQGLGRTSTSLRALDMAFIGLAASAGAMAVGLAKIALSTTKTIDETAKFATQIGTTTEALTGLRFSAQQFANVSDQQFGMALRRMTRRIAEAAEGGGAASSTFKDLGMDVRALARMSPDKQFLAFADAIKRTDDQGKRLQYTMSLFDTEGMPLVNALAQGSAALEENIALAQRFGVVLDSETAAAAENLMTSLGQLRAVKDGLATEVASRLIPVFADWTQSLVDTTSGAVNMEKIVDAAFTTLTVTAAAATVGLARYTAGLALASAQAVINATRTQVAAVAELRAAAASEAAARATYNQTIAMQGLGATKAQVTAATNALAAASTRLAAAQTAAGVAARGLLGILGGPAGLAITAGIAAAAIMGMRNNSVAAASGAELLTRSIDDLTEAQRRYMAGELERAIMDEERAIRDATEAMETNGRIARTAGEERNKFIDDRHLAAIDTARKLIEKYNERIAELRALSSDFVGPPAPSSTGVSPVEENRALAVLRQQRELAEKTGKARAQLAAIQRLGAKATTEERAEAERLAGEIYDLENARKSLGSTTKTEIDNTKQNAEAIARLSEEVRLATMEGLELAEARALQALNQFATPEEIARVKELSAALYEANEMMGRRRAFGEDPDAHILGDTQPLSGGAFDDQLSRYEAEAEVERERYQGQLDRLQEARELQIETNRTYNELEEQAAQDHADRMAQIEQAKNQVILSSTSDALGAMADVLKQSHGEQSGIYKAMFAASKAFAIAESVIKIQQGIANAASLPFPANLGAMATVVSATAGILSTIAGTSMGGGRQYGGPVGAGKMYRVNETGQPEILNTASGQQYLLPNARGDVVSNKDATGGGGSSAAHVTVNLIEDASRAGQVSQSQTDERTVVEIVVASIRGDGEVNAAITGKYNLETVGR